MARFETVAEVAREYGLDLRSLVNELGETEPDRPRRRSARPGRRLSRNEGGTNGVGP
jgi:hypothetical protein